MYIKSVLFASVTRSQRGAISCDTLDFKASYVRPGFCRMCYLLAPRQHREVEKVARLKLNGPFSRDMSWGHQVMPAGV